MLYNQILLYALLYSLCYNRPEISYITGYITNKYDILAMYFVAYVTTD